MDEPNPSEIRPVERPKRKFIPKEEFLRDFVQADAGLREDLLSYDEYITNELKFK